MVPSGQPVDSGIVGCPIVYHCPAGEKGGATGSFRRHRDCRTVQCGIFTSPSQTTGEQETAVDTETRAVAAGSAEEYTAYLEGKLKKMLESVRGLGEVEVMITLESSEERIVEKDMTADRSQTEEQDSAGGTRTVSSSNTGYQTVYQDGSQGTPFVAKTITPKVEGVLVVAEGAGKGNMTSEITQIAQALFGVEAHKVKVLEK
jgi:stage III sporulation protein AG